MNTQTAPVVIYVTYQGTSQDAFNRSYYVNVHLPLVMKAWAQYGLLSLEAFFSATERDGTIAICECVFQSKEALEAAFASPELSTVMADVPHFTAITPRRARAVAF